MKQWVETWAPLITLVSTVGLLVVTGWYAVLTRGLARSSAQAAERAKSAAESAAKSVAAQVASVDVDFEVRPVYLSGVKDRYIDPVFAAVDIICAGSMVFVHGCRLNWVGTMDEDGATTETSREHGTMLVPPDEYPPPVRLHRGEMVQFYLPEGDLAAISVATLDVTVLYSIDGVAPVVERSAEYHGPQVY